MAGDSDRLCSIGLDISGSSVHACFILYAHVLFLQCPLDKRAKLLDGSGENLLSRGAVLGKNPADANASTGSKGKEALRVGNIFNNMPKTPQGFQRC